MELRSGVRKSLDALFKVAPAHGATPLAASSLEVGERPGGSAPQPALPCLTARGLAAETVDWDAIAAAQNAKLPGRTVAALPVSGTPHAVVAQPARHGAFPVDWPAVAASVNAELGLKSPGANVDPALAAHLAGTAP
jgi:hypothetical protein